MMKLEILYKNKFTERFPITVAWQDIHMGFDTLYFETANDENGKGRRVKTEHILTWKISQ